ncbi:MAG: UvrD-helicase domain-containing protein [Verrucomicrobia bacterium]|nr:UvrD-helicase domain-containing protein [Verrucomicrobiota bacterium]
MDAVEAARQIAARLHTEAVQRGESPWRPYEFAMAEAKRREIDVEAVAEGAAQLNGARATYSARDQLILYEDKGIDFEKAFLIAHEIGHAELGDSPDDGQIFEVDPTRSAESSPVGMDRVIDYSHRQRLEVQMDLFAREFLLPRKLVRQLHLDQGLTVTSIASKLGANLEIVAQQLLDALLLPEVEPASETLRERTPNSEQREASNHRGPAYLLEAGPGTGKTQTLITRVESLLSDGVDPAGILLLTFSNKAAGEMAHRLAQRHPQAAAAISIGTFHAFGLDLIRRFNDQLDLPKNPRLLDRTEAVELLEVEFHRLNLIHFRDIYDSTPRIAEILGAISRAKDEVVNADRYLQLAQAMLAAATDEESLQNAQRVEEIAQVYRRYEEIKRAQKCVDFGDLVLLPALLLEQNEEVRNRLQQLYDHVLVDEYQDVNRSSVRLLAALKPDGKNLWVVGDPKQSIYRFRGASSFNVTQFGNQDFSGGQRGRLIKNYRSSVEIVDTFSTFATQMRGLHEETRLVPTRDNSGIAPELQCVERGNQLSVALADNIEKLREQGFPYRNQAVLCGGNERLAAIAAELESLKIPVLFLGSLFERREIKDLLSLLSILTDRRAAGLLRVATWPEFAMRMEDVVSILNHLRDTQDPPRTWLNDPGKIPRLSREGVNSINRLAEALAGFTTESQPWRVLSVFLLDRTRQAADIALSNDVAVRAQGVAIWQFMNFLRGQPAAQGLPIVRLLNRVRRLILLGDDRDLRQMPDAASGLDAVRLMTIHGAKGLEFDVIHLPGMSKDTLPTSWRRPPCPIPDGMIEGAHEGSDEHLQKAHDQEQECLFYVALSRAKERLCFYAAKTKSNGHNRPTTPFLERLQNHVRRTEVAPTREIPAPPEETSIPAVLEADNTFRDSELALYDKCPRRFLYTHILRTGGKRQQTGLMMMHDAVRQVCDELAGNDEITDEQLVEKVQSALKTTGLSDHGYVDDYKALAEQMLGFLRSSRNGRKAAPGGAAEIEIGGHNVKVAFDETLTDQAGNQVIRRIRSGHFRKTHEDDLATVAFILMGTRQFPGASLEVAYLADQKTWEPSMGGKKLGNRAELIQKILTAITTGQFPAERSSRTCPNCPALFVCGEVPLGNISKKVS